MQVTNFLSNIYDDFVIHYVLPHHTDLLKLIWSTFHTSKIGIDHYKEN